MGSVAFVGPVDNGKSTLIGRLLWDSGALPKPERERMHSLEKQVGLAGALVNLLDALQEEREGFFTLDTTRRVLGPEGGRITIIDTPGHLELITNMLTGASSADTAMLVLDLSRHIDVEAERYARVLAFLGLRAPGVVLSKTDLLESWEQVPAFEERVRRVLDSHGVHPAWVIPVSALDGTNIKKAVHGDRALLPSLRELVARAEGRCPEPGDCSADAQGSTAFRMLVQGVEKDGALCGRVVSGALKRGQILKVWPSGQEVKVQRLLGYPQPRRGLEAGDFACLRLAGSPTVERGALLADSRSGAKAVRQLILAALWFDEEPPRPGQEFTVHCGCQSARAQVLSFSEQPAENMTLYNLQVALPEAPLVFEAGIPALSNVVLADHSGQRAAESSTHTITVEGLPLECRLSRVLAMGLMREGS